MFRISGPSSHIKDTSQGHTSRSPVKVTSQRHTNKKRNTPCLKKLCKFDLLELCQIFTNFDNFLHKDDKQARIMRDALIFHLT